MRTETAPVATGARSGLVVFAGCLVLCSELVEIMPIFAACIAGCVAADP